MKKTDKKIENAIRVALTDVCEILLETISGFEWITHIVNYKHFPQSLIIVCVFKQDTDLQKTAKESLDSYLYDLIDKNLKAKGVSIKNCKEHVIFDTQESCDREHSGKWADRLSRH